MLARELLENDVVALSGDMLIHPENYTLSTKSNRVVWAFPTYSWGIPPVVLNFMHKVGLSREAEEASHYMLTTCGDDMAYTDRQWRSVMHHRKLNAVAAYAVRMPNTYVCMSGFDVDFSEVANAKILKAPFAVRKISESILNGGKSILIRKWFSFIKSYLIYPWFVRHDMSPKPFHSTSGCIGCRKCALSCPMANIRMKDYHPEWGDNCALCLRCYHICPEHAVAYGKKTAHKGQYKSELREL